MSRPWRIVVLLVAAVYFFVPLWQMVDYTFRDYIHGGKLSVQNYRTAFHLHELIHPLVVSLELAALTAGVMLVILVPTMVWARLWVPKMVRLIEFLCLLPLTIPPLVVVVGSTNLYKTMWHLTGSNYYGPLLLTVSYVVLVLPYAYRSIEASLATLDLRTLAEASTSLGGSWWTVIVRVVLPNIRGGVITAVFLTLALVMGEFTFANILGFQTLPIALVQVRTTSGGAAMAMSLVVMVAMSLLMVAGSALAGMGRSNRRKVRNAS